MKNTSSIIILLFGVIILNISYPMKIQFASLYKLLIGGLIGLVIGLILYPILKLQRNSIVFFKDNETNNLSCMTCLLYISFISGIYLNYNISIIQSFGNPEIYSKITIIYLISNTVSYISYIILNIIENAIKLRAKLVIFYGLE